MSINAPVRMILRVIAAVLFIVFFGKLVWSIPTGSLFQGAHMQGQTSWGLNAQSKALIVKDAEMSGSQVTKNSRAALALNPLNEDALLYLALFSEDREQAVAMLEQALKRDPRNVSVINVLLSIAYGSQNHEKALDMVSVLYRLRESERGRLGSILDQMALTSSGMKSIHERLSNAPLWGHSFLERQIENSQADTLNQTWSNLQAFTEANAGNLHPKLSSRFITKLVDLRLEDQAYAFWLNNFTTTPERQLYGIFNSSFEAMDAPIPFNWQLYSGRDVNHDIKRRDGLYTSYHSGKSQPVARQFFKLPSGDTFALKLQSQHKFERSEGHFEVVLNCLSTDETLLSVPLDRTMTKEDVLIFDMPLETRQCDWLEVQLRGVSGVFPSRLYILWHNIKIVSTR